MSSVKKNTISLIMGRGGSAIIGFLFLPLYLPLLGKEAFGLVALSMAFAQILLLLNSAIQPVLVTQVSKNTANGKSNWMLIRANEYICFISIIVLLIVGFSLSGSIVRGLDFTTISTEQSTLFLNLMFLTAGFNILYGAYGSIVFGYHHGVWCSGVDFFKTILNSVGGYIVLLFSSGDPMSYFLWLVLNSLIFAVLTGWKAWEQERKNFYNLKLKRSELKSFQVIASASIVVTGVCALNLFLERWSVGVCINAAMVGTLVLLLTPMRLVANIASMVCFAILPKLAETAENQKDQALRIFMKGAAIAATLYIPCAYFLSLYYKEFYQLWLRESQIESVYLQLIPLIMLYGFIELCTENIRRFSLSHNIVIQRLPFAILFTVVVLVVVIFLPALFSIRDLILFKLAITLAEAMVLLKKSTQLDIKSWLSVCVNLILLPSFLAIAFYLLVIPTFESTSIYSLLLYAVTLPFIIMLVKPQRLAVLEIRNFVVSNIRARI